VSIVKLDLPEPETPVMQVKVPSGMLAVTPVRLFALARFRGCSVRLGIILSLTYGVRYIPTEL
jgi:hypothetical protein